VSGPSRRLGEIERLIADLAAGPAVRRDAAVARLRVIGARALPYLSSLLESRDTSAITRAAALMVLDGHDDPKSVSLATTALEDTDPDVAIAAIGVLRGWLIREDGTHALEAVMAAALDKRRDGTVRLAALDALSELPPQLVAPIREQAPIDSGQQPALADPAALLAWLTEHEQSAALSALHAAITGARDRERDETAGRRRDEWTRVRGAAHVALAHRGSRVAVYDLREAFDVARQPLPADFLTAAARIGDVSCLEPMARAWAGAKGEPWWRSRLMESAADIVVRLKLSGRHATIKRIRAKWPGFL
jgi:hypothetical protein